MNNTKTPYDKYEEEIKNIIADVRRRITLNGRKKVFEQKRKLLSVFLTEEMDPEAFTKKFIIEKIFDLLNLKVLPEKHFRTVKGIRKVDYRAKNLDERMFLVEAKPINADLYEKGDEGAVNQIKGLFRLAEVKENYSFGVATDGLTWIFIDKNGGVTAELDLEENYDKIEDFLLGKERVISQKTEEEITKRFYDWYNALLHGGKYKDRENKTKWVSENDCLVNNIFNVQNLSDKEQIAQSIVNRLIFIKFLQSKEIIEKDILAYLSDLSEDILNEKLKQLFFRVLNTPKDERIDIDPNFADIPYLNGSLFIKTDVERQNTDYRMKAEILKEIIKFLDSFRFIHKESFENGDSIDPEILGYIFERAMTSSDRKGTGAYYTPKQITKYIAENTIYPCLIEKINVFLKEERGYKEKDLIKDINDVFILHETTLNDIWEKIILNLKVCDNACGSGAFLLAAGNTLLDLNRKIYQKLNWREKHPDPYLKKHILLKNLYGVDINPNAVEIAKLRLWLWLVASYDPEDIQPLPNIEYNLRSGNTLLGYVDISRFKDVKSSDLEYWTNENSLYELLEEREKFIKTYKEAKYSEFKILRKNLKEIDKKIKKLLDFEFHKELKSKKIEITKEDFEKLKPFHWGFEFSDVFDSESPGEERGFDVIIGNPPYVRADNEDEEYQRQRKILEDIGKYQTLYEKWDFFTVFIERSLKLIGIDSMFSYIVSSSFNTSKFADMSKKFILKNYYLKQIDFFKNIKVFRGVGVENVILTVKNSKEKNKTKRILHANSFENVEELEPSSDANKIFRITPTIDLGSAFEGTELLGNICFVSYGLRPNSDERYWKGEFKKEDLISDISTKINKKPYVEAKYIGRYKVNKIKYLEWDTERCPKKIARPTFPELYTPPKIIRGATVDGTYDESGLICNHSINVMVKYGSLKLISNRSIKNSIKKWTKKTREELEKISLNFDLKYILIILNSKFAKFYLNTIRRHRIEYYFYPDDFKRLPIKKISFATQHPFTSLCNYILFLNKTEERRKSEKELIEFIDKQIIDSLVYELYFKEELKTNLLELIEPYLKDIENLDSDEEKLKIIKEIVEKIKADDNITKEIEKIKSYRWVKIIEGVEG